MRRGGEQARTVVRCIACGATVARSSAREYDRYGDRWEREEKRFEHLCKPCHRRECHQPRDRVEAAVTAAGTRHETPEAFVAAYYQQLEELLGEDGREGGTAI